MSFVFATPEYLAAAATDLANIGSVISSANAAALAPTSSVLAPGADEVSATIAALFDAHSQAYQALSAQAALFHQQFVNLMTGGGAQYALAEAQNASPLLSVGQTVESAISAPAQALAQGAAPAGNGAGAMLAGATPASSGAFGDGGAGAAGQLVGVTSGTGGGLTPAAAALGSDGGASFATGGVAGSGGLIAPGGAGQAVASAEEVGVAETGEASLVSVPPSAVTPLAAVPAAAPGSSAAPARPATPAYSPASAESSEE